MKKRSLITKLALSGVALAATAATLATSTYAWYTTNTDVDANNISGGTAGAADSSIFVSTNGTDFSQSVDFTVTTGEGGNATTMDTANGSNFATASLKPAQLINGEFKKMDEKTSSDASDVLTFYIYFKTAATTSNVPLYLSSVSIQNVKYKNGDKTELNDHLTDNLLANTSDKKDDQAKPAIGVDRNYGKYAVDVVNALGIMTTTTTAAYAVKTASGSVEALTKKLDPQSYVKSITSTNVGTANALNYYNEVMNAKLTKKDTVDTLTAVNTAIGSRTQIATLKSDGSVCAVKFDIFLNGWDDYCYDACKGQSFTFNLAFSSVNTASSSN